MDLKKLKPTADVRRLQLRHPETNAILLQDNGVTPVTISLISSDAPEYRALVHKQNNARIKDIRTSRRGTISNITSESTEAQNLELATLATRGWDGIIENGNALPPSPENVRRIYTEYPWIREQVEEFINERTNFLGE